LPSRGGRRHAAYAPGVSLYWLLGQGGPHALRNGRRDRRARPPRVPGPYGPPQPNARPRPDSANRRSGPGPPDVSRHPFPEHRRARPTTPRDPQRPNAGLRAGPAGAWAGGQPTRGLHGERCHGPTCAGSRADRRARVLSKSSGQHRCALQATARTATSSSCAIVGKAAGCLPSAFRWFGMVHVAFTREPL